MTAFDPKLLDTNLGPDLLDLFAFIDGYLLEDLESLNSLKSKKKGRCNYPMILTLISGMDLMGTFVNGKRTGGYNCLAAFMTTYMDKKYSVKVAQIFFELVRNGTAHYYLTKRGVAIDRGAPEKHMTIVCERFYIDLDILYSDFLAAYRRAQEDIVSKFVEGDVKYIRGYTSLKKDISADDKYNSGIVDSIDTFDDPFIHSDDMSLKSLSGASMTSFASQNSNPSTSTENLPNHIGSSGL